MTIDRDDANALARAVSDRRRLELCAEIESLISVVSDENPRLAINELILFLQEPERSRLALLLEELREYRPFEPEIGDAK